MLVKVFDYVNVVLGYCFLWLGVDSNDSGVAFIFCLNSYSNPVCCFGGVVLHARHDRANTLEQQGPPHSVLLSGPFVVNFFKIHWLLRVVHLLARDLFKQFNIVLFSPDLFLNQGGWVEKRQNLDSPEIPNVVDWSSLQLFCNWLPTHHEVERFQVLLRALWFYQKGNYFVDLHSLAIVDQHLVVFDFEASFFVLTTINKLNTHFLS